MNDLFKKYRIYKFDKVYPHSKTPRLQRFYNIECNDIKLLEDILNTANEFFPVAYEVEEPILLYEPNDYGLAKNQKNLDLIRIKDAYDISHGNPATIIGISDTWLDEDHEDLINQISLVLVNNPPSNPLDTYHGTGVSGCAIAETDNGIGIASSGFDCKLMFSSDYGNFDELIYMSQLGADVISCSWGYCYYSSDFQDAIDEIHNNGTVVVAAAGNGPGRASCPPNGNGFMYPASLNHVISVTSVGHINEYGFVDPIYGANNWKDCHEEKIGDVLSCHTHNDKVDICAAGYNVNSTHYLGSYSNYWGTSFATPQVAGVIALMLTANPSLTPDNVASILENTAVDIYDIPENYPYIGLLGAGRINAYAAINEARAAQFKIPPYSTGFENGLDSHWKVYESHNKYGRCHLNESYSPHSGNYHLTMDVSENGNYNTNEAWLHLNLSSQNNVLLKFWWKEYADESHDLDGIYLSSNGGLNFTKVYSLTSGSSTWQQVSLDVSSLISQYGLNHSSNFIIKFQQYDNYKMTTDGIAIDDIQICVPPAKPSYISGPYEHCIFEWEEYTCTAVPDAVDYEWDFTGKYLSGSGRTVEVMDTHEGWYTLKVRAINICGQYSNWKYKSIYIENCWEMMGKDTPCFQIVPNPADNYIEIILDIDKLSEKGYILGNEYQLLLIDAKGLVLYNPSLPPKTL